MTSLRQGRATRALLVLLLAFFSATATPAQQTTPTGSPQPKASRPPVANTPPGVPEKNAPALASDSAPVLSPADKAGDKTTDKPADNRYRLGPGDVLDIRVFNRPQLSREAVRIDGLGKIRMPLIEGEIQAACQTENELAVDITKRLQKYYRNPHVDVFIKEYQSEPVAVIGAVNQPGRFQLQRRVRLLELITFANGAAERAGRTVQIVHAGAQSGCEQTEAGESNVEEAKEGAKNISLYRLDQTLRGEDEANPYVRSGDIVSLPDADLVYIVGNVLKPSAIPLKEPITISRAIAMAGGTLPDTKSDKVRISRQVPGSREIEMFVDLKAIAKRQAEDIALQANDVIEVPTSSGKRLVRSLFGAIVPTAAQLPMQVIR